MSRFLTDTLDGIEITRAKDVKKHGEHDQSSHGNWAHGIEVASEEIREVIQQVKDNEGLTIDMKDGDMPKTGFTVAKGKKFAQIVKAEDFYGDKGEEILTSYLKQYRSELNKENNYLGLWHNKKNEQVYLDVSENIQDEAEAIRRGRERDQISIWDVVNLKEIPTGGTGATKTRSSQTSRFVKDDRRADRGLRQRDLGEVRKRQERFKVIYFDYGLKPVFKHEGGPDHDQADHGNWATGRTEEQIARIKSMKDVGPSADEIKNALKPSEVTDEEIDMLVRNTGPLYEAITEDIDEKVEERLATLQAEFPNHEYTEQEKNEIYERVQNELIDNYIENNRDDLESQIRDERGEERPSVEEITMSLSDVFDIEHTGIDQKGNEKTISSRIGYGDNVGDAIQIMGDILNENGDAIGEFTRTFFEKNGALLVEHDLLNIWSEENRGTGFGKEFIQRTEAWYVAKGLDGIVVSTGLEDGARHWARAGYDWRSPDHAESALNTLIASAGNRFERDTLERAEFDSIMARAFEGYEATPEGDLSMKVSYKAMKSMKEDGFPLPAEFANIGYKDGDKEWAGKNLMYGQNFKYSKALTAEGMRLLEGPIDHDGDGLIYDGTPREKPAPSGGNK
jgi:DNA-binding transcriptional MerR regulator